MSSEERRAPGAARIPFDGLVEVGGTLGPSFEAQAVDLSEEGMHVRTAYLPELGQHVSCRFETARGQSVLASGDVVWSRGADRGGDFGIRFTEVDPESIQILKALCGGASGAGRPQSGSPLGTKVRLYIDGLAAPMRAKIRDQGATAITVGSDLGFLQVGKQLELEDTQNGLKRPASIDRVEVAVDPSSHVPQLVVTLRYADVATTASSSLGSAQQPRPGEATVPTRRRIKSSAEGGAVEEASARVEGLLARQAARVRPVFDGLARRTRTALAILTASRRPWDDEAAPRRTTSPPPGGGLHTSGRRVVRGTENAASLSDDLAPAKTTRRKAALAGAVLVTAVAGAAVLKKVHHEPAAASPAAATSETTATGSASPPAASGALASGSPASSAAASASAPNGGATAPDGTPARTSPATGGPTAGPDSAGNDARTAARPALPRPASFGNGTVRHGNVFHLHMDGAIETLQGAPQPTGFVVKLPGRKSLEPAAPLAARDSRIASIKV
ncbi:MAG: PilZ domain-containing protein, partial [Myxococcales bacterium]|nr:PilZ domain-containing protein [Myxococcales bacterium]